MSNIQVKLRRGTEAEHDTTSGGFTGAEGEVTVDTTNDTLRVHDGSTVGGVRLAKHSELSAGGGGTVTSVGTGAGLSGGPINTSGTLSLATIPDMTVLGNTAGFQQFPVPTFIKDEDDMASDSATALATQQSIKAYVDAQVSSGSGGTPNWNSGWVNTDGTTSVANGATLTFTHNLSSTNLITQVYMAKDANGTDLKKVELTLRWTGAVNSEGGCQVSSTTTNQLQVQLAAEGWLYLDSNGDWQNGNWGSTYTHIKVVASASATVGAISKYSSGWVNTDGTTSVADGATLTFTHNLGSDSLNIQAYTADNSSGLNMMSLDYDTSSTSFDVGVQIKAVTTTQLTIQLGQDGNSVFDTNGNRTYASLANKFIKVIAIG